MSLYRVPTKVCFFENLEARRQTKRKETARGPTGARESKREERQRNIERRAKGPVFIGQRLIEACSSKR